MGNNGKIRNLASSVSKLDNRRGKNVSKKEEQQSSRKSAEGFKNVLQKKINSHRNEGIKFSLHATKRIEDRNLEIDNEEFIKLRGAIKKIKDKGGRESLIITDKAAYIVDVNEGRIVTAIGKDNMGENVFTKIDSTLVVN